MKLNRVKIKNFRSIEDLEIKINPACRVLVGINESGKSNILHALALLGEKLPTRDDIREPLPNESQVT
ncbi:MAG: AAA family ATPase, partial [bacterium]|nr:AAA family ATPase [bacterium]